MFLVLKRIISLRQLFEYLQYGFGLRKKEKKLKITLIRFERADFLLALDDETYLTVNIFEPEGLLRGIKKYGFTVIKKLNAFHHSVQDKNLNFNSYCRCSKISKTGWLPKRPRQTGQTQIRLLKRKKQFGQGFPCLLF